MHYASARHLAQTLRNSLLMLKKNENKNTTNDSLPVIPSVDFRAELPDRSARRRCFQVENEMRKRKKNLRPRCDPPSLLRSAGPPPIRQIHLLIAAAYAARGGAGQMTLSDWRDVEQEVKRKLNNEFCKNKQ
jgi:hypothetical protein